MSLLNTWQNEGEKVGNYLIQMKHHFVALLSNTICMFYQKQNKTITISVTMLIRYWQQKIGNVLFTLGSKF